MSCKLLYIPIWFYSNADRIFESAVKLILYIPIWFYSNGHRWPWQHFESVLYIPIWLYSNSSIHHLQSQHIFFTFQSGYIQIIDITSSEQIETNLYIPIWFYSNEKAMSDKGLRYRPLHSNLVIFNCRKTSCIKNACHPLHSNLVIFKSNIEKCSKINSHLYIPIWFYSNDLVSIFVSKRHDLYIPIWFYSNYSYSAKSYLSKSFTFQSGSIQIKR